MTTAAAEALGDASGNAFAKWHSQLRSQRLLLNQVALKQSTQWNSLKTLNNHGLDS